MFLVKKTWGYKHVHCVFFSSYLNLILVCRNWVFGSFMRERKVEKERKESQGGERKKGQREGGKEGRKE